jgi:hypothetical protein
MSEEFTTIKVWLKTRRLLRRIAAATDTSMVAVIERLARDEWERLETETENAQLSHQND